MPRTFPPSTESGLLAIANEILRHDGPDALTVRRVAERADTSTQSVYTHFGGKAGLADALFRHGYELLADELTEVPPIDDPAERVFALSLAYRRAALANPEHYKLMTSRPIAEYTPSDDSRRAALRSMAPLVDALRAGVAEGVFVGEPTSMANQMWAAGHGLISLEINGFLPVDDKNYASLCRALIDAQR
ncbi:MAG: TetR/AcrR family transcriptional regulator [Actinomycetota bacterium]